VNVALAILWKDLVSEWRSRDRVVAMLIFSILMAVVFHFALPDQDPEDLQALTPGLLWTAYLFAALLGLNRSFALELENDALGGLALAPGNRGWIFLGKAAANWVLISIVQVLTAGVFAVFYHVDLLPGLTGLVSVVGLGTLAPCSPPWRFVRAFAKSCCRFCSYRHFFRSWQEPSREAWRRWPVGPCPLNHCNCFS
jgi:heme exporter protein B